MSVVRRVLFCWNDNREVPHTTNSASKFGPAFHITIGRALWFRCDNCGDKRLVFGREWEPAEVPEEVMV